MPRKIANRCREQLAERFEHDGAAQMDSTQWSDWIDRLPLPEFMVLVDLSTQGETQ